MNFNYIILIVSLISQWIPSTILWPNHDISTLQLLQVVHRHGYRNPENWFPNDPFKNLSQYWFEGKGMLTNEGKYQMYRIGQLVREHYQSYLGNQFSPREVYARSSAEIRCLESAQLFLSGAYPPKNTRWQWTFGADSQLGTVWQPISVKSFIPMSEDKLLRVEAHCPTAERRTKQIFESKEVQSVLNCNRLLLSQLERYIGQQFRDIQDMDLFWDTLSIEWNRGYKWSDSGIWDKAFENKTMKTMSKISNMFWKVLFKDTLLQRIRAGPLIDELSKNFKYSIDGKVSEKLFLYSSHDTKLNALMQSLRVFNHKPMPFGSTLFFELHRNSKSDSHFVRIYYLNESLPQMSPHLLRLPKCDYLDDCPIDRFFALTRELIPEDWELECGITNAKHIYSKSSFLSKFIFFLIIIIIFSFIYRKIQRKYYTGFDYSEKRLIL